MNPACFVIEFKLGPEFGLQASFRWPGLYQAQSINTNQYLIDHSAFFQYNIVENLMVRSFHAGVPRLCQGLSTFILLEDIKLKDTMLSTLV